MYKQIIKYNQQATRVYHSERALRDALRRFGFLCTEITPPKAFTAAAGSWIESLEFKDANFNWELDSNTKTKRQYPTMLLTLIGEFNTKIRLCSCSGGGYRGYRLISNPLKFHKFTSADLK